MSERLSYNRPQQQNKLTASPFPESVSRLIPGPHGPAGNNVQRRSGAISRLDGRVQRANSRETSGTNSREKRADRRLSFSFPPGVISLALSACAPSGRPLGTAARGSDRLRTFLSSPAGCPRIDPDAFHNGVMETERGRFHPRQPLAEGGTGK
ncbi:hypothetical protein Bbelb_120830 [Branchiostoma belcheri]|nr:hypothetical protein Bbelb_120830 [Branchiostoma belcheri]